MKLFGAIVMVLVGIAAIIVAAYYGSIYLERFQANGKIVVIANDVKAPEPEGVHASASANVDVTDEVTSVTTTTSIVVTTGDENNVTAGASAAANDGDTSANSSASTGTDDEDDETVVDSSNSSTSIGTYGQPIIDPTTSDMIDGADVMGVTNASYIDSGTKWCTSKKSPRRVKYGPAGWEGVFDCARFNGQYWEASVMTPNGRVKRDLAECQEVFYGRHIDLYCRGEVRRRSVLQPHHQQTANLKSIRPPTDAELARKPSGWGGYYKTANRTGDRWSATTFRGHTDNGFRTCKLFNDRFIICQ